MDGVGMVSGTNDTEKQHAELTIQIERLALNTWPAVTAAPAGPWIFRASGGITKRANSVWTVAGDFFPEGDWLVEAEQFYRSRGLPSLFHISDSSPKQLDALLEAQGYSKDVPCSMLIANTDEVIGKTESATMPNVELKVTGHHDEQWLSDFLEMEGFGEERRAFYNRLFADIEPVKGFFTLYVDHCCAAVGTAVVEDSWAGFINIAVHPKLRGRGLGRILLNHLAVWSRNNGATGLYLQVVNDNEPAMKLYGKAGYTPLFQYHYRSKNI